MQRKDLALRVLSTAAIMSIVTSIAAPAFAGTYYIGKGSIDVVTSTDGEHVHVIQNGIAYIDRDNEIVIKDGTDENDTTLKDADRAAATPAVAPAATPATQEAAGPADAAGESQPDPDDAFTLSEEEEDSEEGKDPTENPTDNPTATPAENPTDDPTENPKKDVVYEYDPADPNPEQQATKLAPTSAAPAAKTNETTLAAAPTATPAADPATTTPAEGSAKKPTKNVIRVINDWAEKVLNIRLSNVNIESDTNSKYADGTTDVLFDTHHSVSAAEVQGTGNTKIELDGQNVLDSSKCVFWAGLSKKGSGNLTITDETSDKGENITAKEETETSGSLRAEGGCYRSNSLSGGGAAIGGNYGQATENITIEGYATVKANTKDNNGAGIGGGAGAKGSNITIQGHANVTADGGKTGAGIGGGSTGISCDGDAENIIIQGYSKVTATGCGGAAIGGGVGSGYACSKITEAKNIVIRDHATVVAKNTGSGAAIGAASGGNGEVTIGTDGATAEKEDVHVTATGCGGAAIGNGGKDTKVTIQGHATIRTASTVNFVAIGSENGNVEVTIKDNAAIDTEDTAFVGNSPTSSSAIGGVTMYSSADRTVKVTIDGGENGKVEIGKNSVLSGLYGAISGTEVKIGNNVLLKMKGRSSSGSRYITENMFNDEAAVGTRSNPTAGGLVNTIGDNTELWYTDYNGVLQKIVHSKNLCKKELVSETAATCTTPGSKTYKCTFESFESNNSAVNPEHTEQWTENTAIDPDAHDWGEWKVTTPATCTKEGVETRYCNRDHSHVETRTTPATGHHWKDNGDGTHTCTKCGATEGQPFNTNSALELRVVDAEGMDQPFTVNQNGTLRTYTGAYDTATLTGDLDTLRYLQDHGAQTIQFVTNGQTSSFVINDLLAQGSGSEVFYLTHRGAEEPTLLLVEADHSELVKD
ncbi:PT domain-containing protein [Faecalibacterium sp. Marseille-P9312]|uniref:PT domain-containing protein n=1 Tax=Faecalibacterium sp. Marseille-P9312 TaxID=2580425 RepID=UPI00122C4188|nr:PT domain-containing protein [Faecalibacterium sp. Marseille-P9312]